MVFAIYNISQCCCPTEKNVSKMSKGHWFTLLIDGALITGAAVVIGLILSGVINTGAPIGAGTLGNGLLLGGCAVIASVLILDLFTLFCRNTTLQDWENMSLVHQHMNWTVQLTY